MHADAVFATAHRPSLWHRVFVITFEGRHYELKVSGDNFILDQGSDLIALGEPGGVWSRRFNVDVADDIPVSFLAFAFWLSLRQLGRLLYPFAPPPG